MHFQFQSSKMHWQSPALQTRVRVHSELGRHTRLRIERGQATAPHLKSTEDRLFVLFH